MGMCSDFDRILIERAGRLGNDSSELVEDVNKINGEVIETLNKCLRPYLININFGFSNKSMMKSPVLINELINNFTYQDEVISYGFILSDKNAINFEDLKEPIQEEMLAKEPLNEIKESIFLKLDDNITKLDNRENLLNTIVGQGLKFNKEIINSEAKEVEFAKKYQMLSKNTALFGEIVRDDAGSQQINLIKVDINEERQKSMHTNIASARSMKMMKKAFAPNIWGMRYATKGIDLNLAMSMANKASSINSKIDGSSLGKKKNKTNYMKKPSYEQKSEEL